MEKFKKVARIAYCIGLAGMIIPQYFYKQFGGNFFPAWPNLSLLTVWVYLFSTIVLAACLAIIFERKGREAALILGGLLLLIYVFGYIPYELFVAKYADHLGTWGDGLKEPALAGGAFVIAGSFPREETVQSPGFIKWLEKLVPLGPLFFCITMVLYGLCHFLYAVYISPMVPGWIPGQMFWTYFAGTALMCAGLAIVFNIKRKLAANLLGIMILIWLIMLHIPRAIAAPFANYANEPVGAFSALAFCAIAFAIAWSGRSEKPA